MHHTTDPKTGIRHPICSYATDPSIPWPICRVILPGNPAICGSVPGTLQAAQLTLNGSTILAATSFGNCPETSNAGAPIPAEAMLNSSDNILVALVPRYAASKGLKYKITPAGLYLGLHQGCT